MFINSESLSLIIGLGGKVQLGSVGVTFNSQITVLTLFTLNEPVWSFLDDGEGLVVACVSIPDDSMSLERSILSNIKNSISKDGSEGVILSGVFTVFVFGLVKEAEHVFKYLGNILIRTEL